MDELDRFERIERYVMGRMTSSEAGDFEGLMEKDLQLAEAVQRKQLLLNGLKINHQENLMAKIKSIQASTAEELDSALAHRSSKLRRLAIAASIAATILLIALGLWLLLPPSNEQLARQFFEPYPDVLSEKIEQKGFFGSHPSENYLEKGMAEYELGNYQEGIIAINNYLKEAPPEHPFLQESRLYLAISHFLLKDYERSTALLLDLDQDSAFERRKLVDWYLGLSLLAEGKETAAVDKLDELSNDKDYNQKVQIILDKM